MVVFSEEANRLLKQYCVSFFVCLFVCFISSMSLLYLSSHHPLCLSSPHLSYWTPVCWDLSLFLSGCLLCMDSLLCLPAFCIILFLWRNRSKEVDLSSTHLSPSVNPAPETLRQRKSKYFPPNLIICVCVCVCVCVFVCVSFFTLILLISLHWEH